MLKHTLIHTRHMEHRAAVPFFAAQATYMIHIMMAAATAVPAAVVQAVAEDAHRNNEKPANSC